MYGTGWMGRIVFGTYAGGVFVKVLLTVDDLLHVAGVFPLEGSLRSRRLRGLVLVAEVLIAFHSCQTRRDCGFEVVGRLV